MYFIVFFGHVILVLWQFGHKILCFVELCLSRPLWSCFLKYFFSLTVVVARLLGTSKYKLSIPLVER